MLLFLIYLYHQHKPQLIIFPNYLLRCYGVWRLILSLTASLTKRLYFFYTANVGTYLPGPCALDEVFTVKVLVNMSYPATLFF